MGYIISGIKTAVEVKVGDTITHVNNPCPKAIEGFEEVKTGLKIKKNKEEELENEQ